MCDAPESVEDIFQERDSDLNRFYKILGAENRSPIYTINGYKAIIPNSRVQMGQVTIEWELFGDLLTKETTETISDSLSKKKFSLVDGYDTDVSETVGG